MDAAGFDPGRGNAIPFCAKGGTVSHAGRNPLILVVEDEHDLREVFEELVRGQGYRVTSAADFPEGAAMLRASRPTLLITDVRLPNGDGRNLGKLARAMDVPVLLVSAHPQDIDVGSGVAFLQKPFRLRDLEREVERLWRLSARRAVLRHAIEHVAQAEHRVQRQRELVDRLELEGVDAFLARDLLAGFEKALRDLVDDRDRLIRELDLES
jgi:DNA-binding response OmpR family regulator